MVFTDDFSPMSEISRDQKTARRQVAIDFGKRKDFKKEKYKLVARKIRSRNLTLTCPIRPVGQCQISCFEFLGYTSVFKVERRLNVRQERGVRIRKLQGAQT